MTDLNEQKEVVDLEFEQLAGERWRMGRTERGLGATDPFQGDPVQEFCEEILDGANYLAQMVQRGIVGEDVARVSMEQLIGLWTMARTAGKPDAPPAV